MLTFVGRKKTSDIEFQFLFLVPVSIEHWQTFLGLNDRRKLTKMNGRRWRGNPNNDWLFLVYAFASIGLSNRSWLSLLLLLLSYHQLLLVSKYLRKYFPIIKGKQCLHFWLTERSHARPENIFSYHKIFDTQIWSSGMKFIEISGVQNQNRHDTCGKHVHVHCLANKNPSENRS